MKSESKNGNGPRWLYRWRHTAFGQKDGSWWNLFLHGSSMRHPGSQEGGKLAQMVFKGQAGDRSKPQQASLIEGARRCSSLTNWLKNTGLHWIQFGIHCAKQVAKHQQNKKKPWLPVCKFSWTCKLQKHTVYVNALIINSSQCHIKEIKNIPMMSFNQERAQIEFFTLLSLCLLFSPMKVAYSVCWRIRNLCLPKSWLMKSVPVSLSVCLSLPNKGLCYGFIEQHRNHHMWRNTGYFTEIFNRILQGIKSLTPADPDNSITNTIVYPALSVCCIQHL